MRGDSQIGVALFLLPPKEKRERVCVKELLQGHMLLYGATQMNEKYVNGSCEVS